MDLSIPGSVEGPGPAWAQRARHTLLRLQVLPGSSSLAWDYKSCLGLQVLPGTTSLAWNYKYLWHYKSCLGLQVLPGTTSLADPQGLPEKNYKTSARQVTSTQH